MTMFNCEKHGLTPGTWCHSCEHDKTARRSARAAADDALSEAGLGVPDSLVNWKRFDVHGDPTLPPDIVGAYNIRVANIGEASALATQEGGDHYKRLKIQPIEYIHANSIPFAEGSVIKYVTRWRDKGGVADLKKARHFLDLLIELEKKAGNA